MIRSSHRDCLSAYGIVTSGEALKTSDGGGGGRALKRKLIIIIITYMYFKIPFTSNLTKQWFAFPRVQ